MFFGEGKARECGVRARAGGKWKAIEGLRQSPTISPASCNLILAGCPNTFGFKALVELRKNPMNFLGCVTARGVLQGG